MIFLKQRICYAVIVGVSVVEGYEDRFCGKSCAFFHVICDLPGRYCGEAVISQPFEVGFKSFGAYGVFAYF